MSDFLELSEKRFSARKFTDQAVSEDDLEYILNSTRLAPSACNRQPWKFIVVASEENKTKLQEYDFETDKLLFVPGDWNTQRPQLYYMYEEHGGKLDSSLRQQASRRH